MRLGVQVMSACLADVSVAGRVAVATRPATDTSTYNSAISWSISNRVLNVFNEQTAGRQYSVKYLGQVLEKNVYIICYKHTDVFHRTRLRLIPF